MVKYSSSKIKEGKQLKRGQLSLHLFKVFIISFSVALIGQIVIFILMLALNQYVKMPARFGIGLGSLEIFRHTDGSYKSSPYLLIIALLVAALNILLHWLRKHRKLRS